MSYSETVSYLYGLQAMGIKFGLENTAKLLSRLNDPHESFQAVHVAGTNGKGSTSAIMASVLQAAGFRVGLFTSPHLVSFTERIKINGVEISEGEVVALAGEIKEMVSGIDDFSPTFFEVVTAMAMLYFKRNAVDIAVLEVGMGGRLDATNIVTPEVSVITSIGYDHRDFLGNTLREIAREKAGIIKKSIPVVASHQEPDVLEVIEKRAKEQNAELYVFGKDFNSTLTREDVSRICFEYREDSFLLDDLILPLAGEHQMQNASVAIKAIALLAVKPGRHITSDFIREGLKNTEWPGRLELIREDPPVVIDGAHNPAGALALSRTLRNLFLRKYGGIILVLGVMDDKDIPGIMEPLLPLASAVILTSPSYSRAASPEKLAGIAASLGFHNVQTAASVKDAIEKAIRLSSNVEGLDSASLHLSPPALILVTGSFYTIGEAKEAMGQRGVLTTLRE